MALSPESCVLCIHINASFSDRMYINTDINVEIKLRSTCTLQVDVWKSTGHSRRHPYNNILQNIDIELFFQIFTSRCRR